MSAEFVRLRKTMTRGGVFNDFSVNGIQYETSAAELGWLIQAWPGRDPVHTYWVTNGKFYGAKVDVFSIPNNELQIEKFDEVQEVADEERKAVRSAITEWEKPGPDLERNESDDLPELQ